MCKHDQPDRDMNSERTPLLSESQKAEFDRRLDDLDATPDDVLSWDELVARLRLPQ